MIYGVVPVGGKGTRLSLPFPKEMLPQKGYDYYNPLMNHIVDKMLMAGADKIILVHGTEYKQSIVDYYLGNNKVTNIKQGTPGFAQILYDFYAQIKPKQDDKILVGMPDTLFDGNPFVEMLHYPNVVCGMFTGSDTLKVDRLNNDPHYGRKHFTIKTIKTPETSKWFWGVLKFDGSDIEEMIRQRMFETTEIGDILNEFVCEFVKGNNYIDLGTWENYNIYLNNTTNFINTEIEKKYDAKNILMTDMEKFCENILGKNEFIFAEYTDYYYKNDNSNIEFIRYRAETTNGPKGDITVKNYRQSQLNRFELVVPVKYETELDRENTLQLLNLLGLKFEFSVKVKADIYRFEKYLLAYYYFNVKDEQFSILEIELYDNNYTTISNFEKLASEHLPGFNVNDTIKTSKYALIRNHLDAKNISR